MGTITTYIACDDYKAFTSHEDGFEYLVCNLFSHMTCMYISA